MNYVNHDKIEVEVHKSLAEFLALLINNFFIIVIEFFI